MAVAITTVEGCGASTAAASDSDTVTDSITATANVGASTTMAGADCSAGYTTMIS